MLLHAPLEPLPNSFQVLGVRYIFTRLRPVKIRPHTRAISPSQPSNNIYVLDTYDNCLCHLELAVLALKALSSTYRPTIVTAYMTRKRNNAPCFVLCLMSVYVTSQSLYSCDSFVVLHACALNMSIVGCHEDAFAMPSGAASTATIKVAIYI